MKVRGAGSGVAFDSRTVTRRPPRATRAAVYSPAAELPITTTSSVSPFLGDMCFKSSPNSRNPVNGELSRSIRLELLRNQPGGTIDAGRQADSEQDYNESLCAHQTRAGKESSLDGISEGY